MSFALGFYEIFSYAIPGFLYILVANLFLQLFKLPHMKLNQLPATLGFVVLIAVLSYLAGHIIEPIAYRWYRLFNRQGIDEKAITSIKQSFPDLNIKFKVQDRRVLYSFIKHNNLPLAEYLDQFHATSVFLHNVSFGLFLFTLTQIAYVLHTGELVKYGLGALIGLLLSFIAVKRSALFKRWYYLGIYEQALHYGNNIEKMFKGEWPVEKSPAPARKPRARTKTSGTNSANTKTSKSTTSKTRATKKKAT